MTGKLVVLGDFPVTAPIDDTEHDHWLEAGDCQLPVFCRVAGALPELSTAGPDRNGAHRSDACGNDPPMPFRGLGELGAIGKDGGGWPLNDHRLYHFERPG